MKYMSNRYAIVIPILPLVMPSTLYALMRFAESGVFGLAKASLIPLLFFLVPVVFFYRNIKLYLWLLFPILLITPIFLFSIYFFHVPPDYKFIALILQTNTREASEAIMPYLPLFVPFVAIYTTVLVIAIRRLSLPRVSWKTAGLISAGSLFLLTTFVQIDKQRLLERPGQIREADLFPSHAYPFSLVNGISRAMHFLEKNSIESARMFRFNAERMEAVEGRQIYALIIGESSRFDRWQVNGYDRPTSPRLARRRNLLTFDDVVSCAHFTYASVPQIITRADPDHFDLQFQELSLLSAFSEAGYETSWLSNHSDMEVFRLGTIALHGRTADFHVFSPTYSPNLELDVTYDGRLLTILDSLLNSSSTDQFFAFHIMGNHFDYSRRYPARFNIFEAPRSLRNSSGERNKRDVLNAYDNSIAYVDFFIDSVIARIRQSAEVSAVMYTADHGEDLYEVYPDGLNFHYRPSASTLRVPLFIWTSDEYNRLYSDHLVTLKQNQSAKIGGENVFFTVLDLANISFPGFDSTKSIASPHFVDSAQKFYDTNEERPRYFSEVAGEPTLERLQ